MDYLVKGEMLTNRVVNKFAHNLREISFLCIWDLFCDLLFQLMKHATNTLNVAFIFCSVYFKNSDEGQENKKHLSQKTKI